MHHVTMPDKTTLYLKDWGTGKPVILLAGWPLSADSWDDQALVLAGSGYRVIAYDRRGFGRSSQPWGGYDYDTLSDDLATVIQQTGAEDTMLVGFSMGGGEVARYMSRHAGKSVSKAVLVSSVVPCMLKSDDNPDGTEQSVFDAMAARIREDRAQFFAGFFKDFFGVGMLTHPVSNELIDWARAQAMQASLRATLECVKSFSTTDFRTDLAAFQVPTLILHGTADKTVPIAASAKAAYVGIAKSTLTEYDGAPHGLFATDKHRLSEDLLDFIRQ
ncbi:alpha/beta hydrolase [Rhodoferax saidenbachensis]|uniref:Pimeloyl-ACP methyl ester carboxylesterase n=1 Tax=Rhodoferax saidenbachensis TaxID=1484693 RepID=A0ABU1ZJR9_9BURK|nr:alpha/beta hydrolase [Rhodoferax saidenbachensis]MDR7305796.1 pimeloyl-ACP methyl ester carboxylesterase [Rhodoferax saidenbachensis]